MRSMQYSVVLSQENREPGNSNPKDERNNEAQCFFNQTNKQGSIQAQHKLELNANSNWFIFDYPIVHLLKSEHIGRLQFQNSNRNTFCLQ